MLLCHGQEKPGEAEAMHHQWALAGKRGRSRSCWWRKVPTGLSKSNETIDGAVLTAEDGYKAIVQLLLEHKADVL